VGDGMINAQTKVASTGSATERNKGVRILAKSIFKELTSQGYDSRQIVSLATELISEVTADLSETSATND
jgi:hypothetical protein